MKYLIAIIFSLFLLGACSKDDNRQTGVCYCEFFSGDKQEYDLTHLSREEQIDACNTHNTNAGNFAGSCELE